VNLLKSPLKRTVAVAAGAFIGLAGAFAITGPASAHHPEISGSSSCVNADGTWQVTWTLSNSQDNLPAIITQIDATPAGSKLSDSLKVGAAIPVRSQGTLSGTQTLPAGAERAGISLTTKWEYSKQNQQGGQQGGWGRHYGQSQKQDVVATKTAQFSRPTEKCAPEENETPPVENPPTPPKETEPSTPPKEEPSSPAPTPSKPAAPTKEPEFVVESDCDSMTVGVTVPEDFTEEVVVTFKPSDGTGAKTVTGVKGETKTVEFKASKGLKITATVKGFEDESATIAYEAPEDCDTSGSGGGEDEPELPLTGAAAGSIAGGAAILLIAGGVFFFVARRRKIKFTA
jgi:LPXTG-motif cell wall-anchored protein